MPRPAIPPPPSPITECGACSGSGRVQYQRDDSDCPAGPSFDCLDCGGSGELVDYDALAWGPSTTPACSCCGKADWLPWPTVDGATRLVCNVCGEWTEAPTKTEPPASVHSTTPCGPPGDMEVA
jgi:hypothetical protein